MMEEKCNGNWTGNEEEEAEEGANLAICRFCYCCGLREKISIATELGDALFVLTNDDVEFGQAAAAPPCQFEARSLLLCPIGSKASKRAGH